jgi:TM2 domain-containing membrane protein YozV
VHRFYLGNIGLGFLYLFTFGLLGIGTFVDIFALAGATRNANGKISRRSIW